MSRRGPSRNVYRELAMCERYRNGETLEAIGRSYEITRERVRQIIKRHGLTGRDGGIHVTTTPKIIAETLARAERKKARVEYQFQRWLGCSPQAYSDLTGDADWTTTRRTKSPAADGPRYKALGNSMAVPVVRWIGERIELVQEVRLAA
jgi:site-specific DNA-cytosine methylase